MKDDDCFCNYGVFESGVKYCTGCSSLCEDCITDRFTCVSCNEEHDFRILNSISQCVCKEGYFDLSVYDPLTSMPTLEVAWCEKCIYNCKTCTSN